MPLSGNGRRGVGDETADRHGATGAATDGSTVGYVERTAGGWTELRVHGVAGTPPEEVLEHPHAELVAGNVDAGFLRRLWEAESVSADTPRRRREVYSWGGLTSGDNLRALWLLLLPFMLLNVAFYMTPWRRPPEPVAPRPARWRDRWAQWRRGWWSTPRRDRRRDRVSSAIQRLLALSLTATFTLTAVTVAMDLVGWKCAAPSGTGGVCGTWWLGWLDGDWLRDRPGRQVAVTAFGPLAVTGLLWWLAGATWGRLERVEPPAGTGAAQVRTPLEDRAMWNGRDPVRRLRAVHVATGLAVPGVFALAAVRPATVWWLALVALLGFLAAMVGLTVHPAIGRRERPSGAAGPAGKAAAGARATAKSARERRSPFRWLPWCAVGLTALAQLVAATAPDVEPAGPPGAPVPLRGTLPWLVDTLQSTIAVQGALLLLLLVTCRRLIHRARAEEGGTTGPRAAGGARIEVRAVWRGHAMPAVALLAWVLAGGLSAGVVLRAADTLGTPVAPGYTGSDPHPLVVPLAYQWVAAAAFALAVTVALSTAVVWWRLRRWKRAEDRVTAAYGARAAAEPQRTEDIARAWARASAVTDVLRQVLGFLLAVIAVVVLVGAAGFVFFRTTSRVDELLVTAGNAVLTASVFGLLWVGRQAYRDPAQRRTVGIAWDLGTFWPRAVHPLAPPCYAERAVPDLIGRLQYLTGTGAEGADGPPGTVLLSCHSQGTVLGAVVLLQVDTATSGRTAFLTYGSPLTRLYGRFFPAYFSARALGRLGGFLGDGCAAPGRAAWRWRNLHRPSDPIGGPVFVDREPTRAGADLGDVDRPLLDPVFPRPAGDPCYPPVLGHSHWFDEPAYAGAAEFLRCRTRSAGETDRRGPGGPA